MGIWIYICLNPKDVGIFFIYLFPILFTFWNYASFSFLFEVGAQVQRINKSHSLVPSSLSSQVGTTALSKFSFFLPSSLRYIWAKETVLKSNYCMIPFIWSSKKTKLIFDDRSSERSYLLQGYLLFGRRQEVSSILQMFCSWRRWWLHGDTYF